MQALVWTAHAGRGRPYVAIDESDAGPDVRRSPEWSRRAWRSLPGVADGACDRPGTAYVARAERVGVLARGDFWATRFGPQAFAADAGDPVAVTLAI